MLFQAMVHIGAVRQTAQITWMSTEALRTGDKAIVNFKFVKCPEWIQAGRRFVFREGRTKAVSFLARSSVNNFLLNSSLEFHIDIGNSRVVNPGFSEHSYFLI